MSEQSNSTRVVVTDVQMPFGSMVIFMVKWTLAAIPALAILALLYYSFTIAIPSLVSGNRMQSAASCVIRAEAMFARENLLSPAMKDQIRKDCLANPSSYPSAAP